MEFTINFLISLTTSKDLYLYEDDIDSKNYLSTSLTPKYQCRFVLTEKSITLPKYIFLYSCIQSSYFCNQLMQNEKYFFSEISNNAPALVSSNPRQRFDFREVLFVLMLKFHVNSDLVVLGNIFQLMLQSQLYH